MWLTIVVTLIQALNGSFNSEINSYQNHRLRLRANSSTPKNITLYKSSLSATFSRASAEFIVNNSLVQQIYHFLNGTDCPDESFWATVAGNPECDTLSHFQINTTVVCISVLPMPGGFSANNWLQQTVIPSKSSYYISRLQIWDGFGCKGNE